MVGDLTSSVRRIYCMDSNIPFIHCRQKTVVHVQVNSFTLNSPSVTESNQEVKSTLLRTTKTVSINIRCMIYSYDNIGRTIQVRAFDNSEPLNLEQIREL